MYQNRPTLFLFEGAHVEMDVPNPSSSSLSLILSLIPLLIPWRWFRSITTRHAIGSLVLFVVVVPLVSTGPNDRLDSFSGIGRLLLALVWVSSVVWSGFFLTSTTQFSCRRSPRSRRVAQESRAREGLLFSMSRHRNNESHRSHGSPGRSHRY